MEIKQIPISSVHPSPMNPRKTFDEGDLQELSDNIETQGLLQPITVRPMGEHYEIVCGERRYRAVSKLNSKNPDKWPTISAIVREMTDEDAFDAMITENLQRKDVDPIEEAFAFSELVKTGKSIDEIAARFGKSVRFVTERVKLNSLIPELMLAVRDDKMPIVAAQIICKLDEEQQKRYYSQCGNNRGNLTKQSAQNFVDNLFMNLSKSLWYQSDEQSDEDFTGGCDRKCSECSLNTANHGCLFYEMKCEDEGRCTDRGKFNTKTLAYMLHELDRQEEALVKAGEPLEFQKAVVGFSDTFYGSDELKGLRDELRKRIIDRGIEVVDPEKVFRGKCYYKAEDERTIEMIKTGEVYRVLNFFTYYTPQISEEYWYVKKEYSTDAAKTESTKDGLPVNVSLLLGQYKNAQAEYGSKLVTECAKTINANVHPGNEPLTEVEKKLFCLLVLQYHYKLRQQYGISVNVLYRADAYKFIDEHPDIFNQCARAWLQSKVSLGNNPELTYAEPILDDLGALWCAEQYNETKEKVKAKHQKKIDKIASQLADLGYMPDGTPTVTNTPAEVTNIPAQFKKLKSKHPDTVILFRVGSFYQLFNKDAEIAAPILELTLAPWHENPKINQCGFSHDALDKMVRKLVKAGKRVAICEPPEDSKK